MNTTLDRTTRERLVSAWVDVELAEALDEAAREADRSRSAELRVAIRQHLSTTEQENER